MTPHITPEVVEAIRFAITSTTVKKPNLKAITQAFHCSYETVRYHKNNILLKMGITESRNRCTPSPNLVYDEEIMYFVTQLLDRDNELYQDEVVDEIYDVFDVSLSQT